jgi:cell wall-associated NlpC family hydrolase
VAQQIAKSGGTALQQQVGAALVSGIESNGSPTILAGGIGPAAGLFQFEPATWQSNGGGKYASVAQDATWQQQVQVFVNATKGDNFGAWGPDLGANYGYSGAPVPGSKVADAISQLGTSIAQSGPTAPYSQTAAAGAPGSSSNIVSIAQSQIGVPYVWGGEDPNSPGTKGEFDCSGLVQWVYGQAGVNLPRVAQAQYNATPKVAANAPLQPGDLLFFGSSTKGIEHVGIYIGNNQMIDAPHTGADVRIDANPTSWGNYVGATRPVDPSGSTTAATGTTAATTSQSADQYGQILQEVTAQMSQLATQYPGMFDTTQAVMP